MATPLRNLACLGVLVFWPIVATALAASAGAEEITWTSPADGGTPRDLGRIERLGPREFRIRASFEEGGESVLRHAVSRVDLRCQNHTERPLTVSVQLDLSGDGQRTDYDTKPESGMKLRDFVFVRPEGDEWRQVNGTTAGWVSTVAFEIPPGVTDFGLSPWYTYADYLAFVGSLPAHPHLEKTLLGASDGGREHWELKITDPAAPPEAKQTIFWHAREHAYESYSSHAMEGLIGFLLSEEAAEFRRRFLIVLHPMTNVDGVAQGFEYRGGYDFPDPRGSKTGRLTFLAVDRWRPHYAVAWHNWVAPRDRNVVFYTDGQDGQPTDRAWLRFTQLFPSLRAAGHRWKDEATPLRYNWHNRQPLSEGNVHQYALKHYGSRIWGWEMPWWNESVEDAHARGRDFAQAFLTTLCELRDETVPKVQARPEVEVLRGDVLELVVHGRSRVQNPYRDAAFVGELTSPSGKSRIVDGFFDGGDLWRLRCALDEMGPWKVRLRGEGVEILEEGTIHCRSSDRRGFLGIHPENPHAFASADGQAYFPLGDTCYGLFDDSPITPELREAYLTTRRAQRFNFVRMTVGHSESQAAADPGYWAWGGTPEQPDLDRFNPEFFRRFDELMAQLRKHGMNVELILLNFYRRPFTDTAAWTPVRERQWLRYLLARYAACDHVFLWTLANEYETHPDGRYRLDLPGDPQWAKSTAEFIKANDPYRHLVTIHPVVSASSQGGSPRDAIDRPWRIGEFFGAASAIDVLSQQTGQAGEGTAWDETLRCWTGNAADVVASVRADYKFGKPVLNSENGYEYLRGHPTGRQQVHHPDKVRRTAWRAVCAGGYVAAGFHGTLGHSDVWNRIDPPGGYTFTLQGEGAAEHLAALERFFVALPFWKLRPFDGVRTPSDVALADPGKLYVFYLPEGGAVDLDLGAEDASLTAQWFDPRSGQLGKPFPVANGPRLELSAPDQQDWTLLLRDAR